MLDAPIAGGANTFVWIVCILVGFVAALTFIDQIKEGKKKDSERP